LPARFGLHLACVGALAVVTLASAGLARTAELRRSVVANGSGDTWTAGGSHLRGTFGQPFAGKTFRIPDATIQLGFWQGVSVVTGSPGVTVGAPLVTRLLGNRPNPFRSTTTVRFQLAAPGRVRIPVYDVTGRRVDVIADADFAPGDHVVRFEPRGLASGIYFYRLEAPGVQETRRLTLVK